MRIRRHSTRATARLRLSVLVALGAVITIAAIVSLSGGQSARVTAAPARRQERRRRVAGLVNLVGQHSTWSRGLREPPPALWGER